MLSIADSPDPLLELERRQDEVLRRLDELDRRVEQAICEFVAVQKDTAERFGPKQKAAA
jgi:tetrahydromethanopterin S-methyltransferase subunit G